MATKINEATELAIPLKNLIGLVTFTAVSVWAYTGITERISFLEHNLTAAVTEIEENDNWIDEFAPPPEVQDNIKKVRELELRVRVLETKLDAETPHGYGE